MGHIGPKTSLLAIGPHGNVEFGNLEIPVLATEKALFY